MSTDISENICIVCNTKVKNALTQCTNCQTSFHDSCALRCQTSTSTTEGVFSCCNQPLTGFLNAKKRKLRIISEDNINAFAKFHKKNEDSINVNSSTYNNTLERKGQDNNLLNLCEIENTGMVVDSGGDPSVSHSITAYNEVLSTTISPSTLNTTMITHTQTHDILNRDKQTSSFASNETENIEKDAMNISRFLNTDNLNVNDDTCFKQFMIDFVKFIVPIVGKMPGKTYYNESRINRNTENISVINKRLNEIETEQQNSVDKTYIEIIERKRRSKNIILYGLPESNSNTPINDDILKVKEIFNNLKAHKIYVNTNNLKVYRLGNKNLNSQTPRTVCIRLNSK